MCTYSRVHASSPVREPLISSKHYHHSSQRRQPTLRRIIAMRATTSLKTLLVSVVRHSTNPVPLNIDKLLFGDKKEPQVSPVAHPEIRVQPAK